MNYDPEILSQEIISKAIELGFDDCGVAKAESLELCRDYFQNWISEGKNGNMSYLSTYFEEHLDPALLVENARSIIVVILNYYPEKLQNPDTNYKVSKYAYGRDYHKVIKKKLKALQKFVNEKAGTANARCFVDSAPVMEKQWAQKAGLAKAGKNTILLHPKIGSFFFIGEIITELELAPTNASLKDSCGKCRICLESCPTDALNPARPYQLDASKCIAYHTIENRGNTADLPDSHQWIYGCDICQDVCPHNRHNPPTKEKDFSINPFILEASDKDWENLNETNFEKSLAGNPVKRAGHNGLMKNIAAVKTNNL